MRRVDALRCLLLILLAPLVSSAQNTVNTIVGGGTPLGNGTALTASLGSPAGVVGDVNGNLYVSSVDGAYVFKIDAGQNVTILAGKGFSGLTGVGGPATGATVTAPIGLALDGTGNNLFIADIASGHVFEVNLQSGVLTNVAGSSTQSGPFGGFSGDGGPATQALLNGVEAVAVFGNTVYILDTLSNRIRSVVNGVINTFAGNGMVCPDPTAACGDGGPATQASLNFQGSIQGAALAVDAAGNVYVADTGDNKVREISATNGTIATIAGNGNACPAPPFGCGDGGPASQATLSSPTGVFVVGSTIYIVDEGDQEVRAVNSDGFIGNVAGNGVIGFQGDGGPAVSASLANPTGVFVDANGNVFIADQGNNRIREVNGNQIINTTAGGGSGGDGGGPLNAVFADIFDVALDAANNQYIIDAGSDRIRKVTGKVISTVAGSGTLGFSGDGGAATAATFNFPSGVTVAPSGNLFIADTINNVVRVVFNGVVSTFAGTFGSTCAPTLGCGDGGPATQASLTDPTHVAIDASGNVFIADAIRIRRVDNTPSHIITTVAGMGLPCSLSTSPCGDGGPATLANLNEPFAVAVDSAGNVFIGDSGDNRVRKVDAKTQVITTVAFNGQATFSGDGGPAILASMNFPSGLALDGAGNLFISGGDHVIRRVDFAVQTVTTVAGNAKQPLTYGFAGDGGPAISATLDNNAFATGLAISATHGLYIADDGNNRIRFVQLVPVSALVPANLAFGNQAAGVGSAPLPVTLTNSGSDDLLISSIVDANSFSQTNNCPIAPAPLAPMQTCTINITFTPGAAGAASDTLIITDNSAGSPHNVPLAGVGQMPFALTTTCTSLSVVPGQSAIYTVDLAPARGFTQSVALSCSGAPALAKCTVNPSSMTLDGATTVQAKVTATTTPPTSGVLKSPFDGHDGNRMAGRVGLAGMAGLAALVILPGKKGVKHARRLCGLIFCLCLLGSVATMSSCGVGGGNADPPGTAAGTYPLTVTGTFKSAAGTTFTETVSFNLVVN